VTFTNLSIQNSSLSTIINYNCISIKYNPLIYIFIIVYIYVLKDTSQLGVEENNTDEDISVITNIMTQKQIILYKQQLTQHVQLITQNYLLSTMSKKYQNNCRKFKSMLVS